MGRFEERSGLKLRRCEERKFVRLKIRRAEVRKF